jgi:hypothetical protein
MAVHYRITYEYTTECEDLFLKMHGRKDVLEKMAEDLISMMYQQSTIT